MELREFLELLEQRQELKRIRYNANPEYEIGAICNQVMKNRGPALYFENPGNYQIPIATLLFGTRARFAIAMNCNPEEIYYEWERRVSNPIKPVIVESGFCKDNILLADEVDLTQFPIPVWNELDGGPYITLPVDISTDQAGNLNCGIYRSQVLGKNTIGIHALDFRHVSMDRAAWADKKFPVAIAIGVNPALIIAASTSIPYGKSEFDLAGALQQEPIKLVKCETIPLFVPAHSEIVLEGEYIPDHYIEEGLFGEATGYYGMKLKRPVIKINAITHRNNPIYVGAYVGTIPHESTILGAIPSEAEILRTTRENGVEAIYLTEGGCGGLNAIVAIKKDLPEGFGKMIAMKILGTGLGRQIKIITVVDHDIDPYNHDEVEWAVITRCNIANDVQIIHNVLCQALDPTLKEEHKLAKKAIGSKMIIDATQKHKEIRCKPNPQIIEKIKDNWQEIWGNN